MNPETHTHQVQFGEEATQPAPQYASVITQSRYLTMRDGVKIAVDVVLPADLPPNTQILAVRRSRQRGNCTRQRR